MQQEQQFQVGDRVIITDKNGKDYGFYGVIESIYTKSKFVIGDMYVIRLYDGRACWITRHSGLKKVRPYNIWYVMPGDFVEYKDGNKRKVLDVRTYIVGLSLDTSNKMFWDFLEREELAKEYKIVEPVGNAEPEDEWEEITAADLEVGDRFLLWSDQNPRSWEEVATHPEDKFIDGNGNHAVAFITAKYYPKLGRYDGCYVRSLLVDRTVYRKKRKE